MIVSVMKYRCYGVWKGSLEETQRADVKKMFLQIKVEERDRTPYDICGGILRVTNH